MTSTNVEPYGMGAPEPGSSLRRMAEQIESQMDTIDALEREVLAEKSTIAVLLAEAELGHDVIAQLLAEVQDQRGTIANLRKALSTNRDIGAAIGILMAGQKVSKEEAFAILKAASQNGHRKLHEIADDVLYTGTLPSPEPAIANRDAN